MIVQLQHCPRAAASPIGFASVSLRLGQSCVAERCHDVVSGCAGVCEQSP